MLAASANAFLCIRRARVPARNGSGPFGNVGSTLAQENGHELVHAGIGEEQVGRIGQQARGGHYGVPLGFEEIQEALSYFGARHTLKCN